MVTDSDARLLLALSGLSVAKFCALLALYKRRPAEAELVGYVSQLTVYPIKSARGLHIQSGYCAYSGLQTKGWPVDIKDRHFMVVKEEDGTFLNQTQEPKMALITPSIHGNMMHLDATGMSTITVPLDMKQDGRKVFTYKIRKEHIEGIDCGDQVAQWLSTLLKGKYRLVFAAPKLKRRDLNTTVTHAQAAPQDQVAFPEIAPYLITSEASLADLNTHLQEPVTMESFRPTIVIKTDDGKPFREDTWSHIYIGYSMIKLHKTRACNRCMVTTVNPKTGIKNTNMEPLRTLKIYRNFEGPDLALSKSNGALFGIHVGADIRGPINMGDPVYVIHKENSYRQVMSIEQKA